MKDSKGKRFWIIIGIGVVFIILLIVLSSILTLGEKLRAISKYVEYGFYGLSAFLVYFLLINPLRIILFAPSFSVVTVLDKDNAKAHRTYRRVAKNIMKSDLVTEDDILKLKESLKDYDELRIQVNDIFENCIKKEINKIIIRNAKTVMISTAISQNGRFDMLTVLSVNLKMIKEIVESCGFRPSYSKLGKLSINVLTTSLIAEGLEGLDFNDIFPQSTMAFFNDVPFMKTLSSSILQGISNALLTIRVGLVTRRYLFTEYKSISKDLIRKQSIKESITMLPDVIKAGLDFFPEKMRTIFKKKENANENTNNTIKEAI